MQFEIDDRTESNEESTDPVAPGTSCYQQCQMSLQSFVPFIGFE
jgi:hypothetical protein